MSDSALMSEKVDLMALALSKVQAEIESVNKDKQGYGYKYADLGACLQAVKKPLRDNGLSISQLGTYDGANKQMLVTLLMHESGQWLKSIFSVETVELKQCNSLQNLGASLTYMRRYALCAIVGLTQEDDDAQSLTKNSNNKIKSDLIPSIAAEVRCLIAEKKEQEAYALCESLSISEKHKLWALLNIEEREILKRIKEAA